jgi:hypothetical protein
VPREQEGAFKADRLSPSHPGVGDGNDEEKVVACARQQGGALSGSRLSSSLWSLRSQPSLKHTDAAVAGAVRGRLAARLSMLTPRLHSCHVLRCRPFEFFVQRFPFPPHHGLTITQHAGVCYRVLW